MHGHNVLIVISMTPGSKDMPLGKSNIASEWKCMQSYYFFCIFTAHGGKLNALLLYL